MTIVKLKFENGMHEEKETNSEILEIKDEDLISVDFSEFSKNEILKEVAISGYKISELNLSSISNAVNLEELAIGWTDLNELDLTPLSGCSRLNRLEIYSNDYIRSIDLIPLSQCKELVTIDISENHRLKKLDLSPLSDLSNLKELVIAEHPILESMDLSPLASCTNLEYLEIEGDPKLLEVDITPLVTCTNLWDLKLYEETEHVHLDSDSFYSLHPVLVEFRKPAPLKHSRAMASYVKEFGWQLVEDIYNMNQDSVRKILWGWRFFKVLGMKEFVGCDRDVSDILARVKKYDYFEGRDFISNSLLDYMKEQIESGRSTLFVDVNVMSDSRLAVFVQRLTELRNLEMQNIELEKTEQGVDLLPLALTAHGFRIVAANHFHRYVSDHQVNQMNEILQENDLPRISISEGPIPSPKHISKTIREIVCQTLAWNK